jgi:hypothetical protein
LLPALAVVGTVTFQRLVQLSLEELAYAQRIGRLRAFYVALAPELEPYVLVMHGPRAQVSLRQDRLGPSSWQLALTTAGMVAVVNSVLIGACAGLLLETLPVGHLLSRSRPERSPRWRPCPYSIVTTGEHATATGQTPSTAPQSLCFQRKRPTPPEGHEHR